MTLFVRAKKKSENQKEIPWYIQYMTMPKVKVCVDRKVFYIKRAGDMTNTAHSAIKYFSK